MSRNWYTGEAELCWCRLKEWCASLQDRQPVNVGLFDMVAEKHDVDIYTLEPQWNPST